MRRSPKSAADIRSLTDMEVRAPEEVLVKLLAKKHLTLACAESCTGGMLASRIVSVPGASEIFLGGVVSYANSAKTALLGVSPETLARFGAVSRETACEMARGARLRFGADAALSTTGIAGPGGGTSEKPVGTVWIGFSSEKGEEAAVFHLTGTDRTGVRTRAVEEALKIMLENTCKLPFKRVII